MSDDGTRIITGGNSEQVYGGRFTGTVRLEMLNEAEADGRPDIARVHFDAGAVTFWHQHPGGQKLLCLSGRGRFGTEEGEHELEPGTFVDTPPMQRHYHGAAAGHDAVLLAITWGATAWEETGP